MTLDEIKSFFGNAYRFSKATGMSCSNYNLWRDKGFIPMRSQVKLESLSGGELKAQIKDGERYESPLKK